MDATWPYLLASMSTASCILLGLRATLHHYSAWGPCPDGPQAKRASFQFERNSCRFGVGGDPHDRAVGRNAVGGGRDLQGGASHGCTHAAFPANHQRRGGISDERCGSKG